MLSIVLPVLLSVLTISCDLPGEMKEEGFNSEARPDENEDQASSDNINIPENVTGTFLACVKTDIPESYKSSSPSAAIGCSFYDEEKLNRIPAENLGKKIEWSYDFAEPVTTNVAVFSPEGAIAQNTPEANIDPYDVYFIFEGGQPSLDASLPIFKISFVLENFSGQRIRYQNTSYMDAGSSITQKEQVTSNNSNAPSELPFPTASVSSLVPPSTEDGVIKSTAAVRSLDRKLPILVDSFIEHSFKLACFLTVSPKKYNKDRSFPAIGCAFYDDLSETRVPLKGFAEKADWNATQSIDLISYKGKYVPDNEPSLFDVYFIFDLTPDSIDEVISLFTFEYNIVLI